MLLTKNQIGVTVKRGKVPHIKMVKMVVVAAAAAVKKWVTIKRAAVINARYALRRKLDNLQFFVVLKYTYLLSLLIRILFYFIGYLTLND